jgi:putative oxidoreductase
MDIGLLLLRLTVGFIVAAHGSQKLFGWFSGPGLSGTGQFFTMLGFPPGRRHAFMAGLAETVGGLFVALGFLTPLAGAAIIAVMTVAVLSVHLPKGFFVHNGGYEYNLVLSVAALTPVFAGPGPLSVDAYLNYSHSGAVWGLAAFVVGVVGGMVALLERKAAPNVGSTAAK